MFYGFDPEGIDGDRDAAEESEEWCEQEAWILENVKVVGETEKGWRVRVATGDDRAHIAWFPKSQCSFHTCDGETQLHLTTWIYHTKLPEAPWLRELATHSRNVIGY